MNEPRCEAGAHGTLASCLNRKSRYSAVPGLTIEAETVLDGGV